MKSGKQKKNTATSGKLIKAVVLRMFRFIFFLYTLVTWYFWSIEIKENGVGRACDVANKLSKVSFMMKSSKGILNLYMIRNVYFTKFQALLRFGILFFWGGIRIFMATPCIITYKYFIIQIMHSIYKLYAC